jgi:hypothetical protein
MMACWNISFSRFKIRQGGYLKWKPVSLLNLTSLAVATHKSVGEDRRKISASAYFQ